MTDITYEIHEPNKGRNKTTYTDALQDVQAQYSRFTDLNPTRTHCVIYVRYYSRKMGYAVSAGYRDVFTGGVVTVSLAFSG